MHIVLASAIQYPDGGPGATRTLALARGLVELGHAVSFIVIGQSEAPPQTDWPDFTWVTSRRSTSRLGPVAWRLELARGFGSTLATVHTHSSIDGLLIVDRDSWILNRCRAAAERLRIPAFHELTEFLEYTPTSGVRNLVESRLLLAELRRLSGVLSISTALQRFLGSNGVPRVALTGPCVDARGWCFSRRLTLSDTLRVGYAGSLSQPKDGVLDLLEVIRRTRLLLPDMEVRLDVVGGSTDELAVAVAHAKDLGIAHDIRFHGKVRADAVAPLLEGCHVLVLPRPASRQAEGGFPTKLGEYLATGRPVVTTSVGDIPKYLQPDITCLMVPPGNLHLMSEAIASVATDYVHAESIGRAGQQLTQTTFHPRRVADALLQFVASFSPSCVPQPIGRRDIRDSKGLGGA